MANFIELTNTSNTIVLGNKILINASQITTVYERPREEGGSLTTVIYCATNNSEWTVEESYTEVKRLLRSEQ